MALVMSMGITAAFADDPKGTIEITSPKTDPNADNTYYDAYKIFDMTTNGATNSDGDYTAVAYTINSAWANFFATGAPGASYIVASDTDPASLNPIAVDGTTKYINITEDNVANFAKAAFEYAQKNNIGATKTETVAKGATTVKFTDLDLGYYMVYPRGASVQSGDYTSIVSITNTAPNGKVAQKAEWPELTKVADDISTEVGQKVTYTLGSKVPDTTGYTKYEFTFKDKTSAGLTYDGNDSVTVKIGDTELEAGTDYTFGTVAEGGNDFELTINLLKNNGTTAAPQWVAKYTYGSAITITYTATVNANAVSVVSTNNATLTYNNNPKDSTSTGTTPPVVVKVHSAKIVIEKVDGSSSSDNRTKLPGAKFVLRVKTVGTATDDTHEQDIARGKYYKYTAATAASGTEGEEGYVPASQASVSWVTVTDESASALAVNENITVVTTDANGEAKFEGLEDGTYELIEVVAPDGYNLLTDPVEVTVSGSDTDIATLSVSKTIENNSGTVLPSTGGIGTTIFYVVGSILVVVAGVLLVTKKRMGREG